MAIKGLQSGKNQQGLTHSFGGFLSNVDQESCVILLCGFLGNSELWLLKADLLNLPVNFYGEAGRGHRNGQGKEMDSSECGGHLLVAGD